MTRPTISLPALRPAAHFSILMLAVFFLGSTDLQAQTGHILHSFTGSRGDGSGPQGLVVVDQAGNVYGSTPFGANRGGICAALGGCGMVFRAVNRNGAFVYNPLYLFHGNDGAQPFAGVVVGPNGVVYGTTLSGGGMGCGGNGCGVVFKQVRSAGGYTFQLLYSFTGGPDGGIPQGNVVLDSAGNLYGASGDGGGIFQITPSGTYTLIDTQAQSLQAPISIDAAGNLYGTTYGGGQHGDGSMFKDTYSGGSWTHNVIFSFDGASGGLPLSDVGFDASGNMYVTSTAGGQGGQGTLVQVTP